MAGAAGQPRGGPGNRPAHLRHCRAHLRHVALDVHTVGIDRLDRASVEEALAIALYVSYFVHVRVCKPLFEAPELLRGVSIIKTTRPWPSHLSLAVKPKRVA